MRVILLICCLSFLLQACLKKDNLLVASKIDAPKIKTVSAEPLLNAGQVDSTGLSLLWYPADYGPNTQINYMVEITANAADFETARVFNTGTDLQKTFTVGELNSFILQNGGTPGQPLPLYIRIKSSLGTGLLPQFSTTAEISITPYKEVLSLPLVYVPGSYQQWAIDQAPFLASINNDDTYEGYLHFPDEITLFKITPEKGWQTAYGGTSVNNQGNLDLAGENLKVDGSGYYLISVNLSSLTWSASATQWSMIGDAAMGWQDDVNLTFDPAEGIWKTIVSLSAGSFKFRANADWMINYGDKDGDGILDKEESNNITIEEPGDYLVVLDLRIPGNYQYRLQRQ